MVQDDLQRCAGVEPVRLFREAEKLVFAWSGCLCHSYKDGCVRTVFVEIDILTTNEDIGVVAVEC